MPSDTLTILCPAKINLALSVGAPRAEDGMHPICSWMVAVEGFEDTLSLTKKEGHGSTFDFSSAQVTLISAPKIDWPLEEDLAFRAHALMQDHTGTQLPVDVALVKRIPAGAGLGGGSSDAAGMLFGLNRLFNLGLSEETLVELGLRLGSDVGFLVRAQHGMNSAVVGGVGEKIVASPLKESLHIVILPVAVSCSTSEVYSCFDELYPNARLDLDRVNALAASEGVNPNELFNDLAEPALKTESWMEMVYKTYQKQIDRSMHVSGSGSCLYVVAESAEEAEQIKSFVLQDIHAPALVTRVQA